MRQIIALFTVLLAVAPAVQESGPEAARRKTYDTLLDLYVRDGLVYYRALKADRARLDAYVNAIAAVSADQLPRDEQIAFWLNAYNALVLSSSSDAIAGAIGALMTRPDSGPLLSSIRCPTLVAVGEEDTVTPRSAAEAMHRAIPGSDLVTIPQAGHLTNLEQPAAFNAALARFLEHRL